MKKFFKIFLIVFLIFIVGGLLAFVNSKERKINCNHVEVSINYSEDEYFITIDEVRNIVEEFCLAEMNDNGKNKIQVLENKLNNHPAIQKCELYTNVSGILYVDIKQRRPIGRIINKRGDSYYLDENGKMMPVFDGRPSRVVVVNGEINEIYAPNAYYFENDSAAKISVMDDIYQILKVIDKSEFWKAQVEQIYINSDKEFILIPKVGNHEVLFGKADHVEGKLNKLKWFYEKGLPAEGWKSYKIIDVRYKAQVICRGNETLFDLPSDTINKLTSDTLTNL